MLSCLVDYWPTTQGYLPKEPKTCHFRSAHRMLPSGRVLAYRISHFLTRHCAAAVLVRRKPRQQVCQGELTGGWRYEDSRSIFPSSYETMVTACAHLGCLSQKSKTNGQSRGAGGDNILQRPMNGSRYLFTSLKSLFFRASVYHGGRHDQGDKRAFWRPLTAAGEAGS